MDLDSKEFLKNVKALAFDKHLKVESFKNSAKLGRHLSESGKFSLKNLKKYLTFKICFLKGK